MKSSDSHQVRFEADLFVGFVLGNLGLSVVVQTPASHVLRLAIHMADVLHFRFEDGGLVLDVRVA